MTAPPPSDWIDKGQNAMWFFGVAFMGMMVFLFGRPIEHPPRKQTQRTPRKQKRTARKSRIVQKPKKGQKMSKPENKSWYVPPPMTAHEHAEYAKYYNKSRGVKADDWAGIPD